MFGSPSKPFSASKAFELLAHVNPPAFVAPLAPPKPLPSAGPSAPTVPVEPSVPSPLLAPVAPATLATLTVQPGDSLWKLAALHLGAGLRWREFLSVNPNIQDANHIEAGSQIVVPAAAYPSRKLRALTVQQGDTLSGIAKAHLGRASAWHCIAGANPSILNPHLIYPGQSLLLPTSCKP